MKTAARKYLLKTLPPTRQVRFTLRHQKSNGSNQIYSSDKLNYGLGFQLSIASSTGYLMARGKMFVNIFIYKNNKLVFKHKLTFAKTTSTGSSSYYIFRIIDTNSSTKKPYSTDRYLEEGLYDVVVEATLSSDALIYDESNNANAGLLNIAYNKIYITTLKTTKSGGSNNKAGNVDYYCNCLHSIEKRDSLFSISIEEFTESTGD